MGRASRKNPPHAQRVASEDGATNDDRYGSRVPLCRICNQRTVDGADGLCSICRGIPPDEPNSIEVPDVTGMTSFLAKRRLASAGLVGTEGLAIRRRNWGRRGMETIHEGEEVMSQNPAAGIRAPRGSSVSLSYSFAGEIEHNRDDYNGEIVHRNGEDQLHREGAPAWIVPENFRAGLVYGERWLINGKTHREDGPAKTDIYKDGTVVKTWERDDQIHREDGPAVLVEDQDGNISHEEYYRIIDGTSVLHREDGPAFWDEGIDGKREEAYFLRGEEMSREEWLHRGGVEISAG